MYFKPTRLLQVAVNEINPVEFWEEMDPSDAWAGYPYKFNVKFSVQSQAHGDLTTTIPFFYTGMDIKVGDWISSGLNAVAVRITEIINQTDSELEVIAEDVNRYNTISDPFQSGSGGIPAGYGLVFQLDEQGMPDLLGVVPGALPAHFVTDLMARFSRQNEGKSYITVKQAGHTFVKGDVIFLDDDGVYKLLAADQAHKDDLGRVIGSVYAVNVPGIDYFMFRPRGTYVGKIEPALPSGVTSGQLVYIDPVNPGKLTIEKPTRFAVPIYIAITSTSGVLLNGGSGSGSSGPLGYNATSYVLADIAARDAIDPEQIELGDFAFVTDAGDGSWGFYEATAKELVEVPSDPPVDPPLEELQVTWTLISSKALQDDVVDLQTRVTTAEGKITTIEGDIETLEGSLQDLDASRISNDGNTTSVETQLEDHADSVVVISKGKQVVEAKAGDLAVGGEKIVLTNIDKEVQVVAKDTAGVDNIDIRLIPQNSGHVYLGVNGDGIVEAENTFDLIVKGGDDTLTDAAGALVLTGGNAKDGNNNGGDVIVRPGEAAGTGTTGRVYVEDVYTTKIVEFKSSGENSGNWLEITNGTPDPDLPTNGVKIGVAAESAAANVDIYLDPKNAGLARVSDLAAYSTALNAAGTGDALVTKAYVLALAGLGEDGEDAIIVAGDGLTDTNGTFSVNVAAATIDLDGVGNLIVSSSAVSGQFLISSGVEGEEAVWGSLNLSDTNSFTGVLGTANGGLGISTFARGDILVGNASNGLEKLTVGAAGQLLQSNGTTLTYSFISKLYDDNGLLAFAAKASVDAVNNLYTKNAAESASVELGVEGEDDNIGLLIRTVGTGIIEAQPGYTANIGLNDETIVTRKFVADYVRNNVEPFTRYVKLDSAWGSQMNIGAVTPAPLGKNVVITRAMINVKEAITGGGVTQARIMAGTDLVMEFYENDILATGVYVADLAETFTSNNTQLTIQFMQSDGTTAATPVDGELEITISYRFR